MDSAELNHIKANFGALVSNTDCNATLCNGLWQRGLISDEEKEELLNKTESNTSRATKLYHIVQKRSASYRSLIEALQVAYQTGPVAILQNFYNKNTSSTASAYGKPLNNEERQDSETRRDSKNKYQYTLDFGEHQDVRQVLDKVKPEIINALSSEVNKGLHTTVILHLAALDEVFERHQLQPLENNSGTQRQRMVELFATIGSLLSEDDIRLCLECLCNMEEIKTYAKHFRTIISKHYPTSLKKNYSN